MSCKAHIYKPREGRDFDTCHHLHPSSNSLPNSLKSKLNYKGPKPQVKAHKNSLKPTQETTKKVKKSLTKKRA